MSADDIKPMLTEQDIDDIILEGGHRNAAGGIYATSVYAFAKEVAIAAIQADRAAAVAAWNMRTTGRDLAGINAIIGKHFKLPGNAWRAHVAIAEALRAQPTASVEPSDEAIWSEQARRMAEDAARYRWLRDPCSGAERVIFYCRGDYGRGLMSGTMLDAVIDDAMRKEGRGDD